MHGMNVLYFATGGVRTGLAGGARLRNMISVFNDLNSNITVFSIMVGDRFSVYHEKAKSNVYVVNISIPVTFPMLLFPFISLFILILSFRYAKECNIILAQSPTTIAMFPAVLLSKALKKTLIIDHIDTKPRKVPWGFYRFILKSAKIVLVLSKYLAQEARFLGCKTILFFPIFIDTDFFKKNCLKRAEIRKKYALENHVVIGFAGSFWHGEGLPYLLEAFKRLCLKYNNLKLFIIGAKNVPDSDDIPKLIDDLGLKEKCVLLPKQPYDLMPEYLSAIDIACAPKIVCPENIAANPIKIYEYMSMNLPVVASAIGEITHVIKNTFNGFLIKPENIPELEGAMELLIRNPELAKEVGENARESVIKNYGKEVALQKIMEILKSALS